MYQSLLPYSPERDVYRLLQVEPTANEADIQAACRRLARHFHPDRNGSPRANQEMQVVNAVRALMSDRTARAAYDRARRRFYEASRPAAAPTVRPGPSGPSPIRPGSSVARSAAARRGLPILSVPAFSRVARPAVEAVSRQARALLEVLETMIARLGLARCPSCRAPVEAQYRYCAECGATLERPKPLATRRAG